MKNPTIHISIKWKKIFNFLVQSHKNNIHRYFALQNVKYIHHYYLSLQISQLLGVNMINRLFIMNAKDMINRI